MISDSEISGREINKIKNDLFEITEPTPTEHKTRTLTKKKTVRQRVEGKWIEFEVDEDSEPGIPY